MAIRTDFAAGEVLAAADLNDTFGAKLNLAGGKILQVVYAETTTEASNNSSTTYADTNLSASITPSATGNKVLVIVAQIYRLFNASGIEAAGSVKLRRDSTDIWLPGQNFALAVGAAGVTNVDFRNTFSLTYLDSPSAISATTYKTQFNRHAGTIVVQGNSTRSSIILAEVSA